jgi:diazepam-binding inhibitor (GABA receptor modulator, acyl-CoA-binding protein)
MTVRVEGWIKKMEQREAFEAATGRAKELPKQPNDVLLELYGLFKQSTEGDVSGEKPGMFDFVGVAKYEAWETRRGVTKDDAMQAYIELVDRLGAD